MAVPRAPSPVSEVDGVVVVLGRDGHREGEVLLPVLPRDIVLVVADGRAHPVPPCSGQAVRFDGKGAGEHARVVEGCVLGQVDDVELVRLPLAQVRHAEVVPLQLRGKREIHVRVSPAVRQCLGKSTHSRLVCKHPRTRTESIIYVYFFNLNMIHRSLESSAVERMRHLRVSLTVNVWPEDEVIFVCVNLDGATEVAALKS